MVYSFDKEKNEFFIFEESGNVNKNEIVELATKILKEGAEIKNHDSNNNHNEIEHTGLLCMRPFKNKETGLIDHVLLFSCSKNEKSKNITRSHGHSNENNQNDKYHLPVERRWIFDPSVHFSNPGSGNFKALINNGTEPIKNKGVVWEIYSGEEYSSLLLEKSYLFTGVYMANNIIINVSIEEFFHVGKHSRFDTIFKIFFAYVNALQNNLINENEKKTFWIVTKNDTGEEFEFIQKLYSVFIEEMLFEILRYSKQTNSLIEFNPKSPNFQFLFLPWTDNTSEKVKDYLFSCVSKDKREFSWESETMRKIEEGPSELYELISSTDEYVIPTDLISNLLDDFDRFAEENLNFYKTLAFSDVEPIEIIAEAACSKVVYVTLELVKCVMRPWHKLINSGWVQGLGKELDQLIKKVEEFYEREAGVFKHTKAYQRKLSQLVECFFMESRVMFQPQMNHLKENLKQYFKSACSNIGLTESIERDLNQLINLFDEEFINQAKSSIPGCAKKIWSYNYERENLKKYMIELVDEKMKMTYYKGLLVKKVKTPISIWFHALFPHPFGKDLSNEPFTTEDTFSYDTREVHRRGKASLMRHVLARKVEWDTPQKNKKVSPGEVSQEDYVFKENPKKAIKRLEKNR
uniref:Uncharacterized protein n=1 Tax=Hemiselmis tepida TaxID=464990 RepID=A0A7S0W3A1_9CRYP|mmetsp:Transcript_3397/g.8742  ORF Transcript_3397/g.8742 Transcript_3397/m.8742 type:complete len:634 (+) Transcript_3397:67-1968(+)